MRGINKFAAGAVLAGALVFTGGLAPANAVQQDGLVNVNIGDVTILEDVRIAVAATVLANVCNIPVTVNVLAEVTEVDQPGSDDIFTCTARNGRTIAVTDN